MTQDPFRRLGMTPAQSRILHQLADATISSPRWTYNDGGRAAVGLKGSTGDCVARAISIACLGCEQDLPHVAPENGRALLNAMRASCYKHACALIEMYTKRERLSKHRKHKSGVRKGVWKPTTRRILTDLGWSWRPTMAIGGGCTTHLRADELPPGRIIVQLSKHVCAVVDGVVHDTYDPSRDGTRCVYGYWYRVTE